MNDIYTNGIKHYPHSLRYMHITAKNVVGILNRIASLMRRRRYNMQEVSVSFDDKGLSHIIIAIDGEVLDVEQVMHQVAKLHDVIDVYDATHKSDKLFTSVYVKSKDRKSFESFPEQALKVIENTDGVTGIFSIPISESSVFIDYLNTHKFEYIRRVMSLI